MIKLILAFGVLFAAFYAGIEAFRDLTKRQRWSLTKTLSYSIICALLAIATMTSIVILF